MDSAAVAVDDPPCLGGLMAASITKNVVIGTGWIQKLEVKLWLLLLLEY